MDEFHREMDSLSTDELIKIVRSERRSADKLAESQDQNSLEIILDRLGSILDSAYSFFSELANGYNLDRRNFVAPKKYPSDRDIYFYELCQIFQDLEKTIEKTEFLDTLYLYKIHSLPDSKTLFIARMKGKFKEFYSEEYIKENSFEALMTQTFDSSLANLPVIEDLYLDFQNTLSLIAGAEN